MCQAKRTVRQRLSSTEIAFDRSFQALEFVSPSAWDYPVCARCLRLSGMEIEPCIHLKSHRLT